MSHELLYGERKLTQYLKDTFSIRRFDVFYTGQMYQEVFIRSIMFTGISFVMNVFKRSLKHPSC